MTWRGPCRHTSPPFSTIRLVRQQAQGYSIILAQIIGGCTVYVGFKAICPTYLVYLVSYKQRSQNLYCLVYTYNTNSTIPGPLLRPQRSRQPLEGPGTSGRGQGNADGRAVYILRVLCDVRGGHMMSLLVPCAAVAGHTMCGPIRQKDLGSKTLCSGEKTTYHFLGSGRLETATKI